MDITLSDEPQLLAVNWIRRNGPPALTGHYLVDILSQSYIPQLRNLSSPPDGRSCSSLELQTSNLATSSESPTPRSWEFRWTHCSRMADPQALPLAYLRYPKVSAVMDSPVAATVASFSPSATVLERMTPDQNSSFLRVWHADRRTVEWFRLFLVDCDAYIDSFGAEREQGQQNGSVMSISYISRATLDSETHGLRSARKLAVLSGPRSAFEATFGARISASFRITTPLRTSVK